MIFTSYTYLVFLAFASVVHWLSPQAARKWILVVLSYVFYCAWHWEYAFLLLGVSLFNWRFGILLSRRGGNERLLSIGIAVNLAPLLYFKYTGFLVRTVNDVLAHAAADPFRVPQILLPLGVSFFTFQGVAYLVDVATGERPFAHCSEFLLFKGFWPQLIAGPIIRPGEIRTQIEVPRVLSYEDISTGLTRIGVGVFKKVVLADNLAPTVDLVFGACQQARLVDALVGLAGFGLQIYFDFSAYSDIAIGSARLFGFRFPENFDWPYLASNPRAFWEHWHMTLSRWIRDYVFTPLAFALRGRRGYLPAVVLISMAICGLWHGAAWTFVLWGVWHGVLLLAGEGIRQSAVRRGLGSGRLAAALGSGATLAAVFAGWALFRAKDVADAGALLGAIGGARGGLRPGVLRENAVLFVGLVIASTILVHLLRSRGGMIARPFAAWRRASPVLLPILYAFALALTIAADQGSRAFVYFQF